MVDGARMPNRMTGPHSLPLYTDSYQSRVGQPGRMMEGAQNQSRLANLEAMTNRAGDVSQEPLDDLLSKLL